MSFRDFSFKLDGHAIATAFADVDSSALSASCATRLNLSQSGNTYSGTVSVQIGTGWLTCVLTLQVSIEENAQDLILGRDWRSHLEELCAAMKMRVPVGLVRFASF